MAVKIFYQEAPQSEYQGIDELGPRYRFIDENGFSSYILAKDGDGQYAPCWSWLLHWADDECCLGKCKSQEEAINIMRLYDKRRGWPKAEYLGSF